MLPIGITQGDVPKYQEPEALELEYVHFTIFNTQFVTKHREFLNSEYFSNPYLRKIQKVALDYFDKNGHTVGSRGALMSEMKTILSGDLEGDDGEILHSDSMLGKFNAVLANNSTNLEYLSGKLTRFGFQRKADLLALSVANMKYDTSEWEIKKGKYIKLISDFVTEQAGTGLAPAVSMNAKLANLPTELAAHYQKLGLGIPTGFTPLDQVIDSLGGGELWFWIAPPGVGKSNILINLAANARLQGKKVLVVSNELSQIDVLLRTGAVITGMAIQEVSKSHTSGEASSKFMSKYTEALNLQLVGDIDLITCSDYQYGPDEVDFYLTEARNKEEPYDMLIYDAFYRAKGIDPKDQWTGSGEVSKGLIKVLKKHGIGCHTADQVNRSRAVAAQAAGRLLGQQDMKGDSAKYEDATYVFTLNQTSEDRTQQKLVINVAKARKRGPTHPVELLYFRDTTMSIGGNNDLKEQMLGNLDDSILFDDFN